MALSDKTASSDKARAVETRADATRNLARATSDRASNSGARRMGPLRTRVSIIALAGLTACAMWSSGVESLISGQPSFVPAAHAQSGQTTSKAVTDAYFEAQELLEQEPADTAGAAQVIQRVLRRDDLSPYERTIMFQFLAQLQIDLERYDDAIRSLEGAIAANGFEEPTDQAGLYYTLGGLYMLAERYPEAVRSLQRFFELSPNANAAANYLMAQAFAVQEQWRNALPFAERAVEMNRADAESSPNEGYMRLLAAIYINVNNWRGAVDLLEILVRLFPGKDEYWQQLAAGYQELGRERDAYAVQELRYIQGFLTRSNELVILADLHSFYGYPYKAARLLSREMERGRVERTPENLERLGQYWLAAREYREARAALIEASRASRNGRLDFQIGGTYAQDEDWEQAERYIVSAIRRGGLSRDQQADAWLLLGNARYYLGKRRQSLEAFRRAAGYNKTKRDAETWVSFLEDQIAVEAQQNLIEAINQVSEILDRNQTAITDLGILRDFAIQAKTTAERARDAASDTARTRALDEYAIRKEQALTRLEGQREAAQLDAAAAQQAVNRVEQFDLDRGQKEIVTRLVNTTTERLTLITEAENNLREAADLIEEVTGTRPETPNVPAEAIAIPAPLESISAGTAETLEAEEGADAVEDGEDGAENGDGGDEDADEPTGDEADDGDGEDASGN